LLVTGSFSILGSSSTINTTSLVVSDSIIALGHSQSGTPVLDEGFMFVRGTGLTQAFIWDESDDTFALIGTNDDHTITGDININSYSNLRLAGLTTSTLTISNGAVNGYYLQTDGSGNTTWVSISGGLTGSGTINYVPHWTNSNTLSSTSSIYNIGENVGINTVLPSAQLNIKANNGLNTEYGLKVEGNTGLNLLKVSKLGRVGIGTGLLTDPSHEVEINSLSANNLIYAENSNNISDAIIRVKTTGAGNSFNSQLVSENSTGNTLKMISFGSAYSIYPEFADNQAIVYTNSLLFNNGNTTRATLTSTGNFGIGTASPNYKLEVSGTVSTTGLRMTSGANSGYVLTSDASGNASWSQLSGGLTGSGTTNYISKWTGVGTLGNSLIQDDSSSVGIGTAPTGPYRLWIVDQRVQSTKYGLLSQVEGNNFSTTNIGLFSYVSGATSRNVGLRANVYGTYGVVQGINVELGGSTTFADTIGVSTFISSSINSSTSIYGGYMLNQGSASFKYGNFIQVSGNGVSNTNYGSYLNISGANNINYGNYTLVNGTFSSVKYGSFINISDSNGTNTQNFGIRTDVNGGWTNKGIFSVIGSSVASVNDDVGIYSYVSGLVTSSQSVSHAGYFWNNTQKTNKYGITARADGNNISTTNYGIYSAASGASNANYGVYSQVSGTFGTTKGGYYSLLRGNSSYNIGSIFNIDEGAYNVGLSIGLGNNLTPNQDFGILNYVSPSYVSNQTQLSNHYISNTGTVNVKYGTNTQISGNGKSITNYGLYNSISGANSANYGFFNIVSGTASANYGIYTNVSLASSITYGNYVILNSGTGGTYYGSYIDISQGVGNNTFGNNNYGQYISNYGSASTNTGLYVQVNNGGSNNALWASVGSQVFSSGDKAVYGYVGNNAKNTTDSAYGGYFDNRSLTTNTSFGLGAIVSSTSSSANYGLYVDSSGTTTNYGVVVNRGTSIFNDSGENFDFRIEGLTESNLLFVDASNDNIGIGTSTPNAKSMLDINSTTKGFLPPRMTTSQREAIISPPAGLMIFNTDNSKHEGYTGTTWSGFY
jgi:hypothetical protein